MAKIVPSEEVEHRRTVCYLKLKYPHVIFTSDMSGIKLPMGLAKKAAKLRSSPGIPDLLIFQPSIVDGIQYHGLFIEMKRTDVCILKANGELTSNKHIREQYDMIQALRCRGYYADFAKGYDEAVKIIDKYLQ